MAGKRFERLKPGDALWFEALEDPDLCIAALCTGGQVRAWSESPNQPIRPLVAVSGTMSDHPGPAASTGQAGRPGDRRPRRAPSPPRSPTAALPHRRAPSGFSPRPQMMAALRGAFRRLPQDKDGLVVRRTPARLARARPTHSRRLPKGPPRTRLRGETRETGPGRPCAPALHSRRAYAALFTRRRDLHQQI